MKYLLLLLISILVSCAGPISPFGSLPVVEIESVKEKLIHLNSNRKTASITGEIIIDNHEIVFHRPHSFNAKFFHSNPGQYKFMIIYNGQIFDPNWFADIKTSQTKDHIEIF